MITDTKVKTSKKPLKDNRYEYFLNEVSEQTKSEYINGEIVVHSPASQKHINANISLTTLLRLYVEEHKLGWVASEKALVNMQQVKNDYEPDVCFFKNEKAKFFHKNTCQFPPPDFAIEILSDSSIKRDRVTKFRDYANHNVEEYWIIDTDKKIVEQYYLEKQGKYIKVKEYNEDDIIESTTVKGFEIPVTAIFDNDQLDDFLFGKYKKTIDEYLNELETKEHELKLKEQELVQKDQELVQKDQELVQNKQAIVQKDQELVQNKQELVQNKQVIDQKDQVIDQKDQELVQKDQELVQKDQKLVQKDKELEQQAEIIRKLQLNNKTD